ncbi:MAG: hypothetical protein ACYDCK_04390 [Thermoplasmatota archaeon]
MEPQKLAALALSLGAHGFGVSADDLRAASVDGTHLSIFPRESDRYVDVKPASDPRALRTVRGGVSVELAGARVRVASPEDTIANKLAFGSEQDVADADSIYLRNRERLDIPHIDALCLDLGVTPAWRDLRNRLDPELARE